MAKENFQAKLIKRLCRQIKYDEELMKLKMEFKKYSPPIQKALINSKLKNLKKEDLINIVKIENDEVDPLYT